MNAVSVPHTYTQKKDMLLYILDNWTELRVRSWGGCLYKCELATAKKKKKSNWN